MTERMRRVNESVRQVLAESLPELKDPRIGLVTVTGVVTSLREHERCLVVTHENPDGDALGSLLAMTLALRQLGKDVVMYLAGDGPLPAEYAFMQLDGLLRELPADMEERTLVAVDCAK